MKYNELAQELLVAVRETPDDKFDYAYLPWTSGSNECGCALHVLGKLGYTDGDDKESSNMAPHQAGKLFDLDRGESNFLFNNGRSNWGDLTRAQLRGASGKAEFERRWVVTFGAENLPVTTRDPVSIES